MINLRNYQQEAINTVLEDFKKGQFVLVQAATGAGKTIIFCEIIKLLLNDYPKIRIAVLAHRKELISQAQKKLLKVWPEAKIGIACASIDKNKDTTSNITIGSIQTLSNTVDLNPYHLIIIDEAHHITPKNEPSQYTNFLNLMLKKNNKLRVLGVTATPFRMGHGYIFGEKCRPKSKNWFPKLNYKIGIQNLQKKDFLCGIKAKVVNQGEVEKDLKKVSVSAGDYNLGELENVMSSEIHIGSAIFALKKHAGDKDHIVVFCVTIAHAEKLAEVFCASGEIAKAIHSSVSLAERENILNDFQNKKIRILCSVGILTEGWDAPHTDCIIMCRPTKSTGLYIQMIGRGMRPALDKKNMLLLDLAGNVLEHGNPDDPDVKIPSEKKIKEEKKITKICPECDSLIPIACKICHDCGHEFKTETVEINEEKQFKEIDLFKKQKIFYDPFPIFNISVFPDIFISKKGNRCLRLKIIGRKSQDKKSFPTMLNHYFTFNSTAIRHVQKFWEENSFAGTCPKTADEALQRFGEITIPKNIMIKKENKFFVLEKWGI